MGKDVQKIGKQIESVGTALTVGITTPILAVGTASLKATMDFDSSMSKVQALSGSTGEELLALKRKAQELGASTAWSASQVSEAMQYMALAGWDANDVLEGTAGILSAASATGEDLAAVCDIITDGLSAFGMEAGESSRFADVLAATATGANTTIEMMGEAFTYAGSVAGAFNYSIEDTALAIGLMANSGVKASNAGTALRRMMTDLNGTIEVSGKNLGTYLIETANADGTMKPFRETLRNLRTAFEGLTDAEKATNAELLVGKTGMAGFLAIMNTSDEALDKLANSIDNSTGSAEQMSEVMLDNLGGQITLLKSGIESLALAIGERLTPYARKLTSVVQSIVSTFNNMSDTQKDQVVKIGAIVACIPPLILLYGKLVKGVGKAMVSFGKFGQQVKSAGSVMKVIFSPANKIVLIMTAIALVAVLVIKYWEPLKAFFIACFNKIKELAIACGVDFEKLKEVFNKAKEAISLAIQGITIAMQWLWKILQPILNVVVEAIKICCSAWIGYFGGLLTGIGNIINGVVEVLGGIIDFIVGVFTLNWQKAWQGVVNIFTGLFQGIAGVCKSVMNGIIGFINGAIRGINKLGSFKMPEWLGGAQIGLNIPEIPMLYKGTDNWQGGTAMIHDRGAEIVDLPRGTRVYPHDESIKKAFNDGARQGKNGVMINISNMTVRKQSDIDEIANALYNKLKKHSFNMA